MRRLLTLLLPLALLAGCTPWTLVSPGKVELRDHASTETGVSWSGMSDSSGVLWTQDGAGLHNVLFLLAVEDGKALFPQIEREARQSPIDQLAGKEKDVVAFRFRKTMTEFDLAELYTSSLSKVNNGVPVTTDSLAPATLDGQPGFRVAFTFTPKDEVRRKGLAVGAVIDGKLYVIQYMGSALYHFGKTLAEAERVIASFHVKKG